MFNNFYQQRFIDHDVPCQQQIAKRSIRKVDFLSKLSISSRASNVRLTSLMCYVPNQVVNQDVLIDMIEAGLNIFVIQFSTEFQTEFVSLVSAIRKAAKAVENETGFDPCVALALDVVVPKSKKSESPDTLSEILHEATKIVTNFHFDALLVPRVQRPEDVQQIRDLLQTSSSGDNSPLVISKIQDLAGCLHLEEIIRESDAILIPTDDSETDIPPEKVFIVQKKLTGLCHKSGKAIISYMQVCDSTHEISWHPTRGEAIDITNSIMEGIDCVLMNVKSSEEYFPVSCIIEICKIAREAESCLWHEKYFEDILRAEIQFGHCQDTADSTHTTAICAVRGAFLIKASAIVIITTSGKTATIISKYKPHCPTVAVTRFFHVSRHLQLFRGVHPIHYKEQRLKDWISDVDERIHFGIDYGKKSGFIKSNDPVVCVTGWRKGAGSSNTLRIIHVN